MKTVNGFGGMFLQKGGDGLWYEMEDEEAWKKAGQGKGFFLPAESYEYDETHI